MPTIVDMAKALLRTEVDQTRDKIIEAAGQVFADRGFHAATVRDVCKLAGANVAAVNYHFRDKLGLYKEVLQHSARAAKQGMAAALDSKARPEEILRAVVRARIRSLFGDSRSDWQFRIMLHEVTQPTPVIAHVIEEIMRPIYARMLALIGEILGLPPDHERTRLCQNSIMGQILLYPLAWPLLIHFWPQLKKTPAQLDRVAEHIADFSLAYLKQEGSRNRRRSPMPNGPRPKGRRS